MAPEILRGASYDHTSDIYSFAIVCWEIITKKEPFGEFDQYQQKFTEWIEFVQNDEGKMLPVTVKGEKTVWINYGKPVIAAITEKQLRLNFLFFFFCTKILFL